MPLFHCPILVAVAVPSEEEQQQSVIATEAIESKIKVFLVARLTGTYPEVFGIHFHENIDFGLSLFDRIHPFTKSLSPGRLLVSGEMTSERVLNTSWTKWSVKAFPHTQHELYDSIIKIPNSQGQ